MDLREDLLVEARDGAHERGAHLRQEDAHVLRVLAVRRHGAAVEDVEGPGPLEDVAERKKAERDVVGADGREPQVVVRAGDGEGGVREHHPLRLAGRPRRVEERQEVVGSRAGKALGHVPFAARLAAPAKELVEAAEAFALRQSRVSEDDHPLDSGAVGKDGRDLPGRARRLPRRPSSSRSPSG